MKASGRLPFLLIFLLAVCIFALPAALAQSYPMHLPLIFKRYNPPKIEFAHLPTCRSLERLQGRVLYANPADYRIAVYIFAGSGWWTKPYWSSPTTAINPDGTWVCAVVTGGIDHLATKYAAFLVTEGYTPPLGKGEASLPDEIFANAKAYLISERECPLREIAFAGRKWWVKESTLTRIGPGPNYFSDDPKDVFVDEQGRLHLWIVYRGGKWLCSEVISQEVLGYGKYIFRLGSRVDLLDQNAVLGLFTWDDTDAHYYHREIDIEFSRWSEPNNKNSQYVVQPYFVGPTMYRFETSLQSNFSTHGFNWQEGRVFFQSLQGIQPFPGPVDQEIASWEYAGYYVPPVGKTNARINLWLFNGAPPSDGQSIEVIVENFEFVPQQ